MKNVNTVIFDMDGVIVDGMPYHVKSWKEALSTIGMSASDLDIYLMEGMTGRETMEVFIKKSNISISDETADKVIKLKREIFNEIFTVTLMKGIENFLLELKDRQYKLALVTGTRLEVVNKVLQMGLENIFKVIVTGEMVNKGKPNPEPYMNAVDELNARKEDCIVIENAPAGITSAKGAGLTCFAVQTSLSEEYLQDADKIFQDIDEVSEFLLPSIQSKEN
ncbi:MAG: HAD family phosphatase [Candidatus Scalindua sp.]|jgi:HAD superfamily hydrolase (TIGR01509 family)|nr:HAD family phosphatase [Candidatus Scalindua sp.]MBT5305435.1 HAD family phosphatase [Candidatus Scalindua sp.]MBT6051611.1 HAD family phosphatase [Candidatus Scalindua sp.]MBT6227229.1 HAD family phosphatase [Candidatus Scalindua sp.]MBT6564208.1 HAD family phosphatase [Candidatus Scalindua sp.]